MNSLKIKSGTKVYDKANKRFGVILANIDEYLIVESKDLTLSTVDPKDLKRDTRMLRLWLFIKKQIHKFNENEFVLSIMTNPMKRQ